MLFSKNAPPWRAGKAVGGCPWSLSSTRTSGCSSRWSARPWPSRGRGPPNSSGPPTWIWAGWRLLRWSWPSCLRNSGTSPAAGAAALPPLDEAGRVADPLVAVDLDGGAPDAVLACAAARARDGDRVLVGIASRPLPASVRPLLAALDLTLAAAGDARECVTVPDPDAEAGVLSQAAARNPQACSVLGQVLRITEALPVGAGRRWRRRRTPGARPHRAPPGRPRRRRRRRTRPGRWPARMR